jgi:hypothetical protein
MPILGIIASSITANAVPNSYESIATVTVGSGGAANVEFTSIPATYTHLQIRLIARSLENNSGLDTPFLRFNSDTGSNYAVHRLNGSGSAAGAQAQSSISRISAGFVPLLNDLASVFGVIIYDVLDYTNTNKYKTVRILTGADLNGSGYVGFQSGLWQNTNAITTITMLPSGGNWAQYSQFALYGIKGV